MRQSQQGRVWMMGAVALLWSQHGHLDPNQNPPAGRSTHRSYLCAGRGPQAPRWPVGLRLAEVLSLHSAVPILPKFMAVVHSAVPILPKFMAVVYDCNPHACVNSSMTGRPVSRVNAHFELE